jgi:hypothetical protein
MAQNEIRKPDLQAKGVHVIQAWRIAAPITEPAQQATLRSWLVHGGFHPMWTYWLVSTVHLRDIPGTPPPAITIEGATHEFTILSLESPPSCPERHPNPDDLETIHHLIPPDVSHQLVGLTDEQAIAICDLMIQRIIDGQMSPDSDFRSHWNRALDATADHYRRGVHR